ncbi:purine-nucleoside phosphorylase [Microvenator marinus]|uniref:Purine nucleoside phosphorylase n=1 Tax=Microvenator marinus TaxID=2600177 RepID=A0A5B8XVG6_9DELT|nr:purine-nucleoside phosphorylase [Microvenator marinus]QED29177.1 purine-nucleoside phosphorylase [Microvenator marinus]
MTYYDEVKLAADWLKERVGKVPSAAMVLGSGLGAMAEELSDSMTFEYSEIPNFPVSKVEGHAGRLVVGELAGKTVAVMQGRVHYYEGWSAEELTLPMRAFGLWGIDKVIITNAAGGINPDFKAGDLMLITDHINYMGFNPLRGDNDDRFGPRFPDMSHAYNPEMQDLIVRAARELNVPLKAGVYVAVAGPSYETPAEIRMFGKVGADAVGMSTVPEAIVANHMGLKVGGISCISNLAAGISPTKLDHAEVKATADLVKEAFASLVRKTVELMDAE